MFARWVVVAPFALGFLTGCGGPPKPTRVSAEEMLAVYLANPDDGDKRYSNRPVIVTGRVEGLGRSAGGAWVDLAAGSGKHVRCMLASGVSRAAAPRAGDVVSLSGKGGGFRDNYAYVFECVPAEQVPAG
jgi:hypothetical protein